MEAFVCQQNIERFRKLLEVTPGEMQRRVIRKLLAAEESKLKQLPMTKRAAPVAE
jgi:hypothetical protein